MANEDKKDFNAMLHDSKDMLYRTSAKRKSVVRVSLWHEIGQHCSACLQLAFW